VIQTPTRDAVYKALVTNHRILEAQKGTLERLNEQIKDLKMKNTVRISF
jgi:hypothetical protein